jgi:hypothetical protein
MFSTLDMLRTETESIFWSHKKMEKYIVATVSMLIVGLITWRVIVFEDIGIADLKSRVEEMQIVGHRFPQLEADYILSSLEGEKVGNLYGDGGYLIHRLWPKKKVMIDPRYFPFKDWIDDYMNFTMEGIGAAEFVEAHKADFWLINYKKSQALEWFGSSDQWTLAFFGPVGGIFVPANEFNGPTIYSVEVMRLKSAVQLMNVFTASIVLRDIPLAKEIKRIAEINIDNSHKYKDQLIEEMNSCVQGMVALTNNDLESAAELFARSYSFPEGLLLSAKIYRYLASLSWKNGDYLRARKLSFAVYSVLPNKSFHDIYNVALTDWHVRHADYAVSDISNEEVK